MRWSVLDGAGLRLIDEQHNRINRVLADMSVDVSNEKFNNINTDILVHDELSDDAFNDLIDRAIDNVLG